MGMAIKRGIVIVFGLALQILLTLSLYMFFINEILIVHVAYVIISLVITLHLIKNSKNYSYTLPWIVILLLFPLVGSLLYIILGRNKYRFVPAYFITASAVRQELSLHIGRGKPRPYGLA